MEIKLTEFEVQRRLNAGEDPVRLSIEHWMENAMYFLEHGKMPEGFAYASRCALCCTYNASAGSIYSDKQCEARGRRCPLYILQGSPCRYGNTAWGHACTHPSFETAIAMVGALRECLKQQAEKQEAELPQFCIWEEGKELTGKVGLRLVQGYDNAIVLEAISPGHLGQSVFCIRQDGTVYRYKHIRPDLGFQLDSCGRVIID